MLRLLAAIGITHLISLFQALLVALVAVAAAVPVEEYVS